jgi:hypothetical protein
MKRTCSAAALVAATLVLLLPGAASAGKPFVLGNVGAGSKPTVTAGAPGVFHVVWNDEQAKAFHYCQVLLKVKPSCSKSLALPFDDSPGDTLVGAPGKAWIVAGADPNVLYLVHAQYVSGNDYVWTSVNNGDSFTGPVKVYGGVNGTNGTNSERPLLFPANASIAFPSYNVGLYVNDAKIDGSGAASEAQANLDQTGLGSRSYNLSLATLSNGTLATADDIDKVYTWLAPNGSNLNATPSWGGPKLVTAGTDSTMHGTDTSTYLAYTTGTAGKRRFEVRRWGGLAFGKPTVLANDNGYLADLYVSDDGDPGVAYRENGTRLRYAGSTDGGKTWKTKTVAASDEVFYDLVMAHDDSGAGLAVWTRDGAIGAADLTEVPDPSVPQVSKTVTKHGTTMGLNVPGSCVAPGKKYKVTTAGQGKGKLTKVKYTFGAQQQTDALKPFGATFTVAKSAKAGASVKVTALGSYKTKTSGFTILISTTVRVCGG